MILYNTTGCKALGGWRVSGTWPEFNGFLVDLSAASHGRVLVEHGALCIFCPRFYYFLPRTFFYYGDCLGGENFMSRCAIRFFNFFSAPCSRWQVVMLDLAFDPQISGMFCLASPRVRGYTKWVFPCGFPLYL
jgi:hypothetical protein